MEYLKRIAILFSKYKMRIFIIFICMIFSFLLGLAQPFISQSIIDDGLLNHNFKNLVMLCCISLLLYIFSSLLEIIKEKQRLLIYNGIRYDLEKKSFLHLMKIKMNFFYDKNSSNIHQTLKEDLLSISAIASNETFQILTAFLSAIGGGIALFYIEWRLGIAIILFMPINCFVTWLMSKKNFSISNNYIEKSREYNEWFGESVNGIKEIRLFGIQKKKEKELTDKQVELIDLSNKQGLIRVKNEQIQLILLKTLSLLLYVIAGILMQKSGITIGGIVAFQTYSLMLTEPITMGLALLFESASLLPSIKRHFNFLEYDEEHPGEKKCQVNGDIVFDNVTFTYDESKPLLTNMNFRIKKGSKIAILGKNGVGKTTLLNLLLRIISPISGRILFSNEDISNYDIVSYRELFGVVSQNIYLFNASIRDNICLYSEISDNRLNEVLNLVNLNNTVSEIGLNYKVGENGSMLSGGQKQKIAIARALVHERPILILDEATSNLDKETVEILTNLFNSELKDNTVICVTHSDDISDMFENKIYL